MQSALSFAPLRPVGFVNFHGAGQGLLFAGRGSLFFHGAGRPSLAGMYLVNIGGHYRGLMKNTMVQCLEMLAPWFQDCWALAA